MFESVKSLKLIVLLLLIYSAGVTVVYVGGTVRNSSGNEAQAQQIAQLNAQIAQQNIQLSALQTDNEDLKAIRALMEKERAEKEAGQRLHKESLTGIRDPFEGLDKYDGIPKW